MTPASLLRLVTTWVGAPMPPLPVGVAADAALRALAPPPPVTAPAPWPHDERTRTAVHEAGHAVAAWACPRVVAVARATIATRGDAAGQVDYQTRAIDPEGAWAVIVIGLAGLAAELHAYGRARSGPARGDLTHARGLVARTRGTPAPWPRPSATDDPMVAYPCARVHRPALDPREAAVLNAAYAMARRLIAAHEARVAAVARLLLDRVTVRGAAIERAIGDRRVITSLGRRPAFWLPSVP